jgi:hypothetical protein
MEGEWADDPVAQDILSVPDAVRVLEGVFTTAGLCNLRPLSGGVSSVVLDAGSKVVRLGMGKIPLRPKIPEVLQAEQSGAVEGIRYEVLPKADTENISEADVAAMSAALLHRGYKFSDPGADNIGRHEGRLVVLDSGAVEPLQRLQKAAAAAENSGPASGPLLQARPANAARMPGERRQAVVAELQARKARSAAKPRGR